MKVIARALACFLLLGFSAACSSGGGGGGGAGAMTIMPPVNTEPVAVGTIPIQVITLGRSKTVDVSTAFQDPEGAALAYIVSSSEDSIATVRMAGSAAMISAVALGDATITVTARDPGNLLARQTFQVAVSANTNPTAIGAIPSQTTPIGTPQTIILTSYFQDRGDTLSYIALSANAAVAVASVADNTLTLTPVSQGQTDITVTARDPDGQFAEQIFSVTVPNRAPLVAAGAETSITLVEVATSRVINASQFFTDQDGDVLTYTASSSNIGTFTAQLNNGLVTIVAAALGSAVLTLTAQDSHGAEARHSITVTVETNIAPAAVSSITPITLTERGQSRTIDVLRFFSDSNGDTLAYTVSSSNESAVQASVAQSEVTVTAVDNGQAAITVTARDPAGLTAMQEFTVTVTITPNRAPLAVGEIPAISLMGENGRQTIDASQFFNDPDGDTLAYTASTSDADVAEASVAQNLVTVTAAGSGQATITVTARDPAGLTAMQAFSATVMINNRAPLAVGSLSPIVFAETTPSSLNLSLSGLFSDPDGDTLTYGASLASRVGGTVEYRLSGASLRITQGGVGTSTITLTASDPHSASATHQLTVKITGFGDIFDFRSSNQYEISVGDRVFGDLSSFSDKDIFRIRLNPETSYQFDVEGRDTGAGTLGDPYLNLCIDRGSSRSCGLDGGILGSILTSNEGVISSNDDGGEGRNARIRFTTGRGAGFVTSDLIYYLYVASADRRTGTYLLHSRTR